VVLAHPAPRHKDRGENGIEVRNAAFANKTKVAAIFLGFLR
jgi:hypothetical protein